MPDPHPPKKPRTRRTARQHLFPGLVEPEPPPVVVLLNLRLTFDQVSGHAEFRWLRPGSTVPAALGRVECTGKHELTWTVDEDRQRTAVVSSHQRTSIRVALERWLKQFPTNMDTFSAWWIKPEPGVKIPPARPDPPFGPGESPYPWIEDNLVAMAAALRVRFSPLAQVLEELAPEDLDGFESYERRLWRKEQKRAEEFARQQETMARLAAQREERERQKAAMQAQAARKAAAARTAYPAPAREIPAAPPVQPPPDVPVRWEIPALAWQETTFPLTDLRDFRLR